MMQNCFSDFKPGQVVEVIGGCSSLFANGRIGIVCSIPKENITYKTSCMTPIKKKNTTYINFYYHPTWGNLHGITTMSSIHFENLRILKSFYYFDFTQNTVLQRKLSDIIDRFSFHLLHKGNFFTNEKEAEIYGRKENNKYDFMYGTLKI